MLGRTQLSVALLLGLVIGGCAGSLPSGARSSTGHGAASSNSVEAEAPSAFADSSGAAMQSSPGAAPKTRSQSAYGPSAQAEALELRPTPEVRPGLATTWGETRVSRVNETPFTRANASAPWTVAELLYNDARGVEAMAGHDSRSYFGEVGAQRGPLTVRLLDAEGRPLPGLSAGGRQYVVGEPGERYVIEIRNHSGARFEAVASVDGLDVIDGQPASFRKRGYLIGPYATLEIDGFRRSTQTVAAFRFGAVEESYAARKGDARNVGVVGVAFFGEAGNDWDPDEVERRHRADPFPGRFATPPEPYSPWR